MDVRLFIKYPVSQSQSTEAAKWEKERGGGGENGDNT